MANFSTQIKYVNFTFSENNIGLCSAVNLAAKQAKTNYIIYSHDDMYFCPDWDLVLKQELDKLKATK